MSEIQGQAERGHTEWAIERWVEFIPAEPEDLGLLPHISNQSLTERWKKPPDKNRHFLFLIFQGNLKQ